MPIEIRRFGVGHRRPDGPPGTVGIEGRVIESRSTGSVAELAFGRNARITPHTNPRSCYFLVIEGGGWVGVGDERTRVIAGEAVVWPPNLLHAAWTDGVPMRAIVVELEEEPKALPAVIAGPVARGEGRLAPRRVPRTRPDEDPGSAEGEPL